MRFRVIELVWLALLGALLVIVQVALAFLPNIELVSLLVYVYAKLYGKKALVPVYLFALLEGIIYGFTIWWVTYLYVWTILVVISILVRNEESMIICAIVTSLFGLSFGLLCSIPTFLVAGRGAGISFFVAGIPFDMAHFAGNLAAAIALYYPVYNALKYTKRLCYNFS